MPTRLPKGSLVDAAPGSAVETAYGSSANLDDVSGLRGSWDNLDKAWLSKLTGPG